MKRLLDAIYRWLHDPRYLGLFGVRVPADEKPQGDIYYAADYERDLKHDTGEDEFETWIARNQDEEERWG